MSKHHISKKKTKGRRNHAGYPAMNDRKTKKQKWVEHDIEQKKCPECGADLDICASGHYMCMECGWQTDGCDYPKIGETINTMHEKYGEPNDTLGEHKCCPKCGWCIDCGDCICEKKESE